MIDRANIFFCGDYYNSNGEDFLCEESKSIIKNHDLSILNFEGSLKGNKRILKAGPHMFQNISAIEIIKKYNFNLVSLANNHIFDYGEDGLKKTLFHLESNNIGHVGAGMSYLDYWEPHRVVVNNIKFSFFSVAESQFGCVEQDYEKSGYCWLFDDLLLEKISKEKQNTDHVVVLSHAGLEDVNFPLIEIRNKYKKLIDFGASIIIGHHPHVCQGFEHYKDGLIFYSLGNFYFDGSSYYDEYSVSIEFQKNSFNFDLIGFSCVDGKVQRSKINYKKIRELNNNLQEEVNIRLNNEIASIFFEKYYLSYFEESLGYSSKSLVKRFIKSIFFVRNYNWVLLLHNLKIESHRFVITRALKNLSKTY